MPTVAVLLYKLSDFIHYSLEKKNVRLYYEKLVENFGGGTSFFTFRFDSLSNNDVILLSSSFFTNYVCHDKKKKTIASSIYS